MISENSAPTGAHPICKSAHLVMRIGLTIMIGVVAFKPTSDPLAEAPLATAELIEIGRRIYEVGTLGSGDPLRANRGDDGIAASGQAAACINCHQRSGFGLFEATNLVPPITGPSLFTNPQTSASSRRQAKGMEHQQFSFLERSPYDELSLATALRDGVSPSGHRFQYLMPRYPLNDDDMSALIAYLRQLSSRPSPGIDATAAHFATVIAPQQDVARKQAFIQVLQNCFQERHPPDAGSRAWQLLVWELTGSPNTWDAQLRTRLAEQPVFALISGLGSEEWEPVHRFSEMEKLPSLFPNLDAAPPADQDFYSFYFSKGVLLEAEVLGQYFAENARALGLTRVVQLVLADSAGAKAAGALHNLLKQQSIAVEEHVLAEATANEIRAQLSTLTRADALVVWLTRSQLETLKSVPPPAVGQIVFSGWLSGLEKAPIPPAWKDIGRMVYPVDAPQRRDVRMQFNLRPWLSKHSIEYDDEILLGNTLAACNLLSEAMSRLRGSYFRDYLIEMVQNYPAGMGNAPAPQAFPRFVLGPGQRYSSKGAYIVKFKDPQSSELELVHDWLVP